MKTDTITAWQNNHHDLDAREAIANLVASDGVVVPAGLSRGMVITGVAADVVAGSFEGLITVGPWSFTSDDAVADAHGKFDTTVDRSEVRVKVWLEDEDAKGIQVHADESFAWESEWVIAGEFFAVSEVIDDQTVEVFLTSFHK